MKTTKKPQSRRAFTLIELLVVIAIISLLVSILLPSLNRAKDLAKQVVCSTTMRNLGLAFSMYLNDYDEWFPLVREHGAYPVIGVWADKLYNGYAGEDVDAFHCPNVLDDRIFIPNEEDGAQTMAYGMQWYLGGGYLMDNTLEKPYGVGHQISYVKQPAITCLLGENMGPHHGYGVHDVGWLTIPWSWGWPDDDRHNGVSNILCVDGHVSPYVVEDAFDELIWYRRD